MTGSVPLSSQLAAAIDASPSGLLVVDAGGTIVMVNREVERVFGYSREELIGREVESLIPLRLRTKHEAQRGGFGARPEPRPMGKGRELVGLRKDGTEFPIEVGLNTFTADGCMYYVASLVDLSAIRSAPVVPRSGPGTGGRILLVDDEGSLVAVTKRRLAQIGYEVTGETSPVTALARLRATPGAFDVVITDYLMPDMNGIELIHEIERICPDLPVILMSGNQTWAPEEERSCRNLKRVLEKPVTFQLLGAVISEVVLSQAQPGH